MGTYVKVGSINSCIHARGTLVCWVMFMFLFVFVFFFGSYETVAEQN